MQGYDAELSTSSFLRSSRSLLDDKLVTRLARRRSRSSSLGEIPPHIDGDSISLRLTSSSLIVETISKQSKKAEEVKLTPWG